MQYWSAEWKAKVLDPQTAMRWADQLEREEGDGEADYFRQAFNEKAVFGDGFSEYRYWATGVHEPVTNDEE
jgi:hypothetical protein